MIGIVSKPIARSAHWPRIVFWFSIMPWRVLENHAASTSLSFAAGVGERQIDRLACQILHGFVRVAAERGRADTDDDRPCRSFDSPSVNARRPARSSAGGSRYGP